MSVELEVVGVKIQMPSNSPVLILREVAEAKRLLPIFIGGPEAHAIDLAISGVEVPRPMTHDLLLEIVSGFKASLQSVLIDDLRNGTFFAEISFATETEEVLTFSARASDAIALAVRCDAPILAKGHVVEEAAISHSPDLESDGEEEMVMELREFLDNVTPEDFSS